MRSERVASLLAGVGAVLVALLTPPEPAGLLRLAAASLLALGVAVSLLARHPRAVFVSAALLVAGLALAPAPASPLWALGTALLALASLAAAHAFPRVQALPAVLGVTAVGAGLVVGLALLLPRLSVAAAPLVLLLVALLVLALGAAVALARHGGPSQDDAAPLE